MTNKKKKDDTGGIIVILFMLLLIFALILVSPGALVVCTFNDIFSLSFDAGQFWTFSILVCLFYYGFLIKCNQNYSDAGYKYIVACVITTFIYLICHFGLHASFPERHFRYLCPIEKTETIGK